MTYFRTGTSKQQDQELTTKFINVDPLSVIYNEGRWKASKVSPMYNLQYDAVKLKQYGSKIRQAIVGNVVAKSSVKYTVNIKAEPQLRFSEDDAHALVITVSSTDGNSKTKEVYCALILSWGITTPLKDSVHLPYMLERGEQEIGLAVKTSLQTLFDCNIKQFCFSQHQLLQFGFSFLEYDMSKQQDNFVLIYRTPLVDHNNKLAVALEMEDMRIILNRAKDEAVKSSDVLNVAYQLLQEQLYHMVTIEGSVFNLTDVILPKAEAKSNGIVKMKTAELVNCFFTVLNEISSVNSVHDTMDVST